MVERAAAAATSASAPAHIFAFGRFELRCAEGLLLADGQPAPLGRRAFDVLTALVLRRERVVSKAELLDLVWPGLVVEDNNLQVHISVLRKLLGPQLIATVPGRGYRFMAEATPAAAGTVATATAGAGIAGSAGSATRGVATGAAAGAGPAGVANASLAQMPASPRARLLLVDDHRVHRLLLARMLELQGHEVASAEGGLQALQRLHEEAPFDLMLLDLDMPGMSGFELLQRLVEHPQWRHLPVIVTSSLEGTANVARCIELGADDYLHKPVNPVLLKARVDASLAKKRRHEQQREAAARFAGAAVAQDLALGGFQNSGRRLPATVLACGVLGLADPSGTQAAEETFDLLNTCYLLLFDAVSQHGGVVNQMVGAEITALFGAPQPLPDPAAAPAAAARAARDAVEMIELLNAERTAQGKPALRIAIGIASGEVVAGQAGTHQRATYACVGEPVDRALRLKLQAAGGSQAVLFDDATQAALAGSAEGAEGAEGSMG
ncbi:MAG: response regulator [Rubrivivax sp.]|nr:response regulator [Rubrivivax sp.]